MGSTEIAVRESADALAPEVFENSVMAVAAQAAKIQQCMAALMKEGEHYGKSFPGDTKKNLLKPGADKLCFMFRLRPDFLIEIRELPGGHREITTRCHIFHIDNGVKLGEGVGSCSTMESKYRWRNAALKCPACGKEALIKGKAEYGGGWVCYGKKGGCGAKYNDGEPSIEKQAAGKVENTDIADTYNTVLKMSKKRAYVDAIITVCAASDIFSQDAEDLREYAERDGGEYLQKPPKTQPPAPQRNSAPARPNTGAGKQEFERLYAEVKQTLAARDGKGENVFNDKKYNEVSATLSRLKQDAAGLDELNRILSELKSIKETAGGAAPEEYAGTLAWHEEEALY
jgi:hypothetical protein